MPRRTTLYIRIAAIESWSDLQDYSRYESFLSRGNWFFENSRSNLRRKHYRHQSERPRLSPFPWSGNIRFASRWAWQSAASDLLHPAAVHHGVTRGLLRCITRQRTAFDVETGDNRR